MIASYIRKRDNAIRIRNFLQAINVNTSYGNRGGILFLIWRKKKKQKTRAMTRRKIYLAILTP